MIDRGEQEIVIDTWAKAGSVAHEIAHALGLWHEQMKPNREKYIKIIAENIIDGSKHNFDKLSKKGSLFDEEFDFNSLMCYHSWAFSIDKNKPTMTKLDGTTFQPQREHLTEKDIEMLNKLYPPIETPTYIELTTTKTVGEKIKLAITADEKNKADIWIDLNNNGKKEANEGDVLFDDYKEYTLESQTIRVCGKVRGFYVFSKYSKKMNKYIELQSLTRLDVTHNSFLKFLDCSNNELKSLDISQNKKLELLKCFNNQLSRLDISQNTKLDDIRCAGNQIKSLDISQHKELSVLDCRGNQLSSLDVSQNTKLKRIWCGGNKLINLEVSQNKELRDLDFTNNQLSSLDVSQNKKLKWLYCRRNQLNVLDVSQNKELIALECSNNQLSNLDISQNEKLKFLYCEGNQLKSLDASQKKELIDLFCGENQLGSLYVSQSPKLERLYCESNQLTSLDVSNSPKLKPLVCEKNLLTCIKVSQEQLDRKLTYYWSKDDTASYSTDCN